jgi:hypothetical protein
MTEKGINGVIVRMNPYLVNLNERMVLVGKFTTAEFLSALNATLSICALFLLESERIATL